jgi:hypothetical protein
MIRIVTRRCVLGVIVCAASVSSASAQVAVRQQVALPVSSTTSPAQGELRGIVRDEHSKPIVGAVVSALGSLSFFAVSDGEGRFEFRALPAGPYLVRAHLPGYFSERGRIIQITPTTRATWTIALTHLGNDKNTTVLAAGVGPVDADPSTADPGDDHGEVAWRLRHAPRSVLKDAQDAVAGPPDSPGPDSWAGITRAVGKPARLASAFFADVPLNGQINLLTATSLDRPQDLFSPTAAGASPVAFVTLSAPGAHGEWTFRGAATDGDVASWIVAGSYKRSGSVRHRYEAGFSYSMQRYLGGNAETLVSMRDDSRSVGAMYAYDDWRVTPRVSIGYGGKYASYDYVSDRGLLSPMGSVTLQPIAADSVKLRALVSHRETAPGADEFLPASFGVWLPPERPFSSVSSTGFRPERLDHVELGAERELAADVIVGFRAFRQHVDDQIATVFSSEPAGTPSPTGHYQVGSAGAVDAHGWGLSLSRRVVDGMRASLDYTQATAEWRGTGADTVALARIAPQVLRTNETLHDLTASLETQVASTATRLLVVYKVNDGFSSADSRPAAGSRFDFQVNQALPFLNFSSAQWEMLVAVRTLFHDDPLDGSIYDELLVLRPPKRVLGGVTVRF